MDFEWDEAKEAVNVAKHGIDFKIAAAIFDTSVVTQADDRRDYGETRFVSIGIARGQVLVVIWTPRGDRRRLISAWKGGRDEQEHYRTHVGRRSS